MHFSGTGKMFLNTSQASPAPERYQISIYRYRNASPAPEKPGKYLETPFQCRRSIYTHFSGTREVLIYTYLAPENYLYTPVSFDPILTRSVLRPANCSMGYVILCIHIADVLSGTCLYDVVRATSLTRLFYASSAQSGFANAGQRVTAACESQCYDIVRRTLLPFDQVTFDDLGSLLFYTTLAMS